MTVGKAASQASHAALYSYLSASDDRKQHFDRDGIGIKVCLRVKDEAAIKEWETWASDSGLPHYLVNDTGNNTHFKGVPTISALGIGPLYAEEAKQLKHLKLYR